MGAAAGWLDNAAVTLQARERAYRVFRERGEPEDAARVAVGIADSLLTFRGDSALAAGWLQRARSLLVDHDHPLMGSIDVLDAHIAVAYRRGVDRGRRLAEEAVARSHRLGDLDTEMVAVAFQGLVLVSSGRSSEGMTMLDEAANAAGMGHLPGTVRAALALDRDDAETSIELSERYLRAVPDDDWVERIDGF